MCNLQPGKNQTSRASKTLQWAIFNGVRSPVCAITVPSQKSRYAFFQLSYVFLPATRTPRDPGHEHIKPTPRTRACVPQPAPQEQDHRKITGTPRICPRAARTPHCSARGTSSGARHTAVGRESERRLRHVHSSSRTGTRVVWAADTSRPRGRARCRGVWGKGRRQTTVDPTPQRPAREGRTIYTTGGRDGSGSASGCASGGV